MSQPLPPELIILASKIQAHFSLENMKSLCFSLSVDPDEIPGATKSTRARETVLYFYHQNRISGLLEQVKKERPTVDFAEEITVPTIAHELPIERQRELQFLLEELEETYNELLEWKDVHNRLDNLSNRIYGQYAKEVRNLYGKPVSAEVRIHLLDVWDRVVVEIQPLLEWVAETEYIGRSNPNLNLPTEHERWFRKIETRYLAVTDCLNRGSQTSVTEEARQPFPIFRKNKRLTWRSWWAELDQLTRELGSELQTQLSRADDKLLQTANELGKLSGKFTGVRRYE